jgi:hypothetical protein
MVQWINHINKTYLNFAAPKIKIFKLDKVATVKDTLYGEEKTTRIYLNPFEIRAFHLDNPWKQLLGGNGAAYREEEDNIQFVMNFEDMVTKIRNLKYGHIAEMTITYHGVYVPYASKSGNMFTIKVNGATIGYFDVTNGNYNTVQKLANAINGLSGFSVVITGKNDTASNLVSFTEVAFKGVGLMVYTLDTSYANITDVIEHGDVILTNKWRLYEVLNANPAGDVGWDYVTYVVSCNLANVNQVQLPSDYTGKVAAYKYGIGQKVSAE